MTKIIVDGKNAILGRLGSYVAKELLKGNSVEVINSEEVRKSEIDLIIEIKSAMGNLTYFCKAKNKKSVNEGDLSSAYLQAQDKKLPASHPESGKKESR